MEPLKVNKRRRREVMVEEPRFYIITKATGGGSGGSTPLTSNGGTKYGFFRGGVELREKKKGNANGRQDLQF